MKKPLLISLLAIFSKAEYNRVGQGIVRIDLEKKYIPKIDEIELNE